MNTAVYVTLCLIWSSTWLVITLVIDDVPPITGAAARFRLAALIYLSVHAFRRISFPADWRTRIGMVAMGVPQFTISYSFVYWGEQYISSGMTALLSATFPLRMAAWAGDRLLGEGERVQKVFKKDELKEVFERSGPRGEAGCNVQSARRRERI